MFSFSADLRLIFANFSSSCPLYVELRHIYKNQEEAGCKLLGSLLSGFLFQDLRPSGSSCFGSPDWLSLNSVKPLSALEHYFFVWILCKTASALRGKLAPQWTFLFSEYYLFKFWLHFFLWYAFKKNFGGECLGDSVG